MFTAEEFVQLTKRSELQKLAEDKNLDLSKIHRNLRYEEELARLQAEMVNLQHMVSKKKMRVAILFEGRDAAGKGGAIKRFKEHLNPRSSRVVALSKPTPVEQGSWYFRRYIRVLPEPGEIVFFDRSWYNRAVVEPVMNFCSKTQYELFMRQVQEFEHMLYEDGIIVIKFWFSISKEEQKKRFASRLDNPLKQWKFSPVDMQGQQLWDRYTHFKEEMFSRTHSAFSPWIIVKANNKRTARLESMRHVLSQFDFPGKKKARTTLLPDPNYVQRYYRQLEQIDI